MVLVVPNDLVVVPGNAAATLWIYLAPLFTLNVVAVAALVLLVVVEPLLIVRVLNADTALPAIDCVVPLNVTVLPLAVNVAALDQFPVNPSVLVVPPFNVPAVKVTSPLI